MIEALENLRAPLLLAATLTTGLQAGTYYTWASGVMPGLATTDDRTFVHAMQQINIAIVNPVFLATFLGAPAFAVLAVASSSSTARPWVIAGAGLAVATVVITAVGNIPLNNALAAVPLDQALSSAGDLAVARDAFESSWVRLNIARAVTSTASLAALVWAALR